MMNLKLSTFAVFLSSATIAGPMQAATLFDQSLTGAQMLTNSDVSFPTIQPTLSGSSIDFGSDRRNLNAPILAVWDLLAAAPRGALTFTIDIDYTPLTRDNDPHFGIMAGGRYHWVTRYDNSHGIDAFSSNQVTSPQGLGLSVSEAATPRTAASGLGPVDPFRFVIRVEDEGAGAKLTFVSEGSQSFSTDIVFPGPLDTDDALFFVMTRASGNSSRFSHPEQYRLNSVAVRIEDDLQSPVVPPPNIIPLPAGLPLLLGGLGVLMAVTRRRS